jgi:hypothetical protein
MKTSFPFKMNGDPSRSLIKKTPKLYTSLFVDACFKRIFGAIYPLVLGVEVEAKCI